MHRAPLRRMLLALLVATSLAACGSRTELLSNLPESDANEILGVLLDAGIDADKQLGKGGASVMVDRDHIARAVSLLQSQGLPPDPHVGFGEIFRKDGLISSPVEERARYVYAISQELSYTLGKIDGVLTARVHIVLSEPGARDNPLAPSSAAVFIKYRPDAPLDTLQPQIRQLIADSIPRLTPDKISFVLVPGAPVPSRRVASQALPSLLGIRVAADSYTSLTLWLGGSLAIACLSLACAGAIAWRARRPDGRATAQPRAGAELSSL